MSDSENIGKQLRELLEGLLHGGGGYGGGGGGGFGRGTPSGEQWGRRIDVSSLSDLYAPQKVQKYQVPPAGIDNLSLSSVDTFEIPGRGEFKVEFNGFFRVARAEATSKEWATADVHVNMAELALRGNSDLGEIEVSLNPNYVSAGQTFGPGAAQRPAKCRIATAAQFRVGDRVLFNKEPVLLMNDGIDSIPPVEDPNGVAHIYRLPLFDQKEPDGAPVGYLTSLRYTVGSYLKREEVEKLRGASKE